MPSLPEGSAPSAGPRARCRGRSAGTGPAAPLAHRLLPDPGRQVAAAAAAASRLDVAAELEEVEGRRPIQGGQVGDQPELGAGEEHLGKPAVPEDQDDATRWCDGAHVTNQNAGRVPTLVVAPAASIGAMVGEASVRVLVVDDDASVRKLLTIGLGRRGFEVTTAADAAGALAALLGAERVDVAVLDCSLPDLHGAELARRLLLAAATQRLPICFLTGSTSGRFRSAAGIGCVAKPASVADLAAEINRLLAWATDGGGDRRGRRAALDRFEETLLMR